MPQTRNDVELLQLAGDALDQRDDLPDTLGHDIAVAALAVWAEDNPAAFRSCSSLLQVVELYECSR